MDFEPGRIVTLKSGGPPLTIVEVDGEEARCIWFAHADDRLQEARIPTVCLEVVDEAEDDFDDEDEDEDDEDEDEEEESAGSKGRRKD